ncbi:MAG: serine/threonine-protein kinase, partial [Planctomycetota bacterium]
MARLDFENCRQGGDGCLWKRLTLQDSLDGEQDLEEVCAECQCSLADLEAYSIQVGQRLETGDKSADEESSGLKQARRLVQNLFDSPDELTSQSDPNEPNVDDLLVESRQLGDFQLIRELGRGGMGVVYEAHQLTLDRSVALKVLPRRVIPDHQSAKRFQREATAAASLHHTNIVPVFDSGHHDGAWFYAMQLIDGDSLDRIRSQLQETSSQTKNSTMDLANAHTISDRLMEDASASSVKTTYRVASVVDSHIASDEIFLPPHFRFVADVGRQTASALGHAHDRGIIHRDVKPANLILDREGVVWLADFGLAKTAEEDLTMTSQAPGTLRYMSPERFKGTISVSGDVYSLGVTLYELLTLEKPFPAENQLELLNQIRSLEPKSPRQINPRIPLDLQTIVQKAMDKNPQRRYATAAAMQEDLERFLDGRPIAARKVSSAEKLWIWSQKNKPLATSLFAIFLLLAVGGTVSSIAAFKFRNQSEANLQLANEKSELAAAKQLETDEAKRQRDIAFKNAYFADMRQAQQDWRNGQIRRMLTTLREYLPTVPGSDVRGWEWYYLLSLAHKDQIAISNFNGVITQTQWNKPGDSLVGVASDGFGVWDDQGQLKRYVKTGQVVDVAINHEGSEVATVVENSVLRIWSVDSGQLARTFRFEDMSLSYVDWNSASNRLVLHCRSDERDEAKIVDSKTGVVMATIAIPTQQNIKLKLSPDGQHLLFASKYELRIYDVESKEIVNDIKSEDFFSIQPMCIAWHPDSRRFAVGAYLQGVRFFELDDVSRKPKLLKQLDGNASVDAIQFSKDGQTFAIGNRSQIVRLYDVESQQVQKEFKGHLGPIRSVAIQSEDQLVSSANDGTIRIWKSKQDRESDLLQSAETTKPAPRYSFGPLAEGRLRCKDHYNGTSRDFIGHGKRNSMPSGIPIARLSPSGLRGASCANGEVKIWDLETCQEIATFVGHRPDGWMSALQWSNSGRFVASASIDQSIKIWDVQQKQLHATLQGQQGTTLSEIEFSFDDSRLSARDPVSCRVWDIHSGREVLSFDVEQPES